MLIGIGGGDNYPTPTGALGLANMNSAVKPRTLREQVQDQIAFHTAKIADLQDALDALTPDIEKALNALQKL